MPADLPHVIAYHKVSPESDIGINRIEPKKFEQQINLILEHGFTPVTFSNLARSVKTPENPLVITFDDGYRSVYTHAFPILKKFNIPAVVFVVTGYLGRLNNWESFYIQRKFCHLKKDELLELHNSGWEIGSHTEHHHYLPALNQTALIKELKDSKEKIEKIINDQVISFCYPYGRYNDNILRIVGQCGYRFATCNIRLFRNTVSSLCIERRSIYSTDSIRSFQKKLVCTKTNNRLSRLNEWIIQKGTIPGISLNIIRNLKY